MQKEQHSRAPEDAQKALYDLPAIRPGVFDGRCNALLDVSLSRSLFWGAKGTASQVSDHLQVVICQPDLTGRMFAARRARIASSLGGRQTLGNVGRRVADYVSDSDDQTSALPEDEAHFPTRPPAKPPHQQMPLCPFTHRSIASARYNLTETCQRFPASSSSYVEAAAHAWQVFQLQNDGITSNPRSPPTRGGSRPPGI
jgi:hypothetical protein